MKASNNAAFHMYRFSTNQRKNQNLVFQHVIRQVNVSCPPSPRLNIGEGGYDRRLLFNGMVHMEWSEFLN